MDTFLDYHTFSGFGMIEILATKGEERKFKTFCQFLFIIYNIRLFV